MEKKYEIMIVAGEASGDSHGAKLVEALRKIAPESEFLFFGAVSNKLREANVEMIVDADEMAITGLPEIARALPMFLSKFKKLKEAAKERKPDVAILVDFPEFNLKLAKSLKKQGIKVIYYISPQLWAWRKYRVSSIKKYVDLLLAILPFEKDWYEKQGIAHVEYVGNPLAKEVYANASKKEFCEKHDIDSHRPIIALLPGSRRKEVSKILPKMLKTALVLANKDAEIQFLIGAAQNRKNEEFDTLIDEMKSSGSTVPKIKVINGETYDLLNASDAAAVSSGTATLETAIIGTPMAIVYQASALNFKLIRPLIKVDHFGLVNLIAEERVAKELIQDDFTSEALAEELLRLLEIKANSEMREKLKKVSDKLGHGGASKKAAEAVLRVLET